jgi:hypothetical protein
MWIIIYSDRRTDRYDFSLKLIFRQLLLQSLFQLVILKQIFFLPRFWFHSEKVVSDDDKEMKEGISENISFGAILLTDTGE